MNLRVEKVRSGVRTLRPVDASRTIGTSGFAIEFVVEFLLVTLDSDDFVNLCIHGEP